MRTERLDLRLWDADDVDALHAIIGDPVTMYAWPEPFDRPTSARWIDLVTASYGKDGTSRFALVRRTDGTTLGDAGVLHALAAGREILDLGYIVHHPYWRQGYAFEAASALAQYAFEVLEAPAVHAHMALDNPASIAVAEKLGMAPVTEFAHERDRGKTHRLYQLVRAER